MSIVVPFTIGAVLARFCLRYNPFHSANYSAIFSLKFIGEIPLDIVI